MPSASCRSATAWKPARRRPARRLPGPPEASAGGDARLDRSQVVPCCAVADAVPDLRMTVMNEGGETVLALSGDLDLCTSARLRERLVDLTHSARPRIVVDLSGLSFVDSTGLGTLVTALKRVRDAGGDMAIRAPTPATRRVIEISGLGAPDPDPRLARARETLGAGSSPASSQPSGLGGPSDCLDDHPGRSSLGHVLDHVGRLIARRDLSDERRVEHDLGPWRGNGNLGGRLNAARPRHHHVEDRDVWLRRGRDLHGVQRVRASPLNGTERN